MRMRMTTLTWRPINRINFTLTNDRLFIKFQSFWFLDEDVLLTSNNHIFKGALLVSSQNLVFCSYTVKHTVLFTLFMVLWLPKVEFLSVLIAEFTKLCSIWKVYTCMYSLCD